MHQAQTYYNHVNEGLVFSNQMASRYELAQEIEDDWNHPQFYCIPHDITVNEGELARFDVILLGNPDPVIQWSLHGRPIASDGSHILLLDSHVHDWFSLLIFNCSKSDEGRYRCIGRNSYGQKEFFVNLKVVSGGGHQSRPHFTMVPGESGITQGDVFVIEAAVMGSPRPNVVWYRGDSILQQSDRFQMTYDGQTNSIKLIIRNLQNSDSGKYRCVATNGFGEAEILIGVGIRDAVTGPGARPMGEIPSNYKQPGAPVFDLPLETTSVEEGKQIMLATRLYSGHPANFKWIANGQPIKMDSRHSFQTDGTNALLLVNGATQTDSGNYCCIATNTFGTEQLCATVNVLPPRGQGGDFAPSFLSKPNDMTVVIGSFVRLDMKVIGRPTPNVKWYRNDVRLRSDPDLDLVSTTDGSYSLIINAMQARYQGVYKCQAENHAGQVTFTANVFMIERPSDPIQDRLINHPRFSVQPPDQFVEVGHPVRMEGTVLGNPRPELMWFHNRIAISPRDPHFLIEYDESQRFRFYIDKAGFDDAGIVQCCAWNNAGVDQFTASIEIKGAGYGNQLRAAAKEHANDIRPYFVDLPKDVVQHPGKSARFDARVIGFPLPTVKWYFGDNSEIPVTGRDRMYIEGDNTGSSSLVIESLKEADVGLYKIVVFNRVGEASATMTLAIPGLNDLMGATEPSITIPRFTSRPDDDITVDEGQPAEVNATLVGEPPVTIALLRREPNGFSQESNLMVSYDNQNRVRISTPAANLHDTGTYTTLAKNDNGEASFTFSMTVVPRNITLQQVNDARMPEVDKRKIRHTLLPPIDEEQGNLDVAPEFLQKPHDVRAPIGSFVRFDSKVTGTPRPEIRWYHENSELRNTDNVYFVAFEGTCYLAIKSATHSEAGRYRCQAANRAGEASFTVVLELQSPDVINGDATVKKPKFSIHPEDQIVDVGDPVRISTSVIGDPTPQITWLQNDYPVTGDDPHVMLDYDTDQGVHMTIDAAQPEHAGIYQIMAQNDNGMAHVTMTLKVKNPNDDVNLAPVPGSLHRRTVTLAEPTDEDQMQGIRPPEFVSTPEDVTCFPGQTVRFDAQIVGRPTPTVEWYYGDYSSPLVTDGNRIPSSPAPGTHSLVIKRVEPHCFGLYRIIATSRVGQTSATCMLTDGQAAMEPPILAPRFTLEPNKDYTVYEGNPLVVTAAAIGDPVPQIIVSRNDATRGDTNTFHVEQANDNSINVRFLAASGEDDGPYRILAINPHGSATCSFGLTVFSKDTMLGHSRESDPSFRRTTVRHKSLPPVQGSQYGDRATRMGSQGPGPAPGYYRQPSGRQGTGSAPTSQRPMGSTVSIPPRLFDQPGQRPAAQAHPGKHQTSFIVPPRKMSSKTNIGPYGYSTGGSTVSIPPGFFQQPSGGSLAPEGNYSVASQWNRSTLTSPGTFAVPHPKPSSAGVPPSGTISSGQPTSVAERHATSIIVPPRPTSSQTGVNPEGSVVSIPPGFFDPQSSGTIPGQPQGGSMVSIPSGFFDPQSSGTTSGVVPHGYVGQPTSGHPHVSSGIVPPRNTAIGDGSAISIPPGFFDPQSSGTPSGVPHDYVGQPTSGHPHVSSVIVPPRKTARTDGSAISIPSGFFDQQQRRQMPGGPGGSTGGGPGGGSGAIPQPPAPIVHSSDRDSFGPQRRGSTVSIPLGFFDESQLSAVKPPGSRDRVPQQIPRNLNEVRDSLKDEPKDTPNVPPKFILVPDDLVTKEGAFVRFDSLLVGDPRPYVTWFHHEDRIFNSENRLTFTNAADYHTMVIKRASPTETGLYHCLASNSAGEDSFTVSLILHSGADSTTNPTLNEPKFTIHPPNQVVNAGEATYISTAVMGEPTPQISWFKDSQPVQTDNHLAIAHDGPNDVWLAINSAQPADAGTYEIIATNPSGTAKVTTALKVKLSDADDGLGPIPFKLRHVQQPDEQLRESGAGGVFGDDIAPYFIKAPKDATLTVGQFVRFNCRVGGKPRPTVEWYHDSNEHQPIVNDGTREAFTNEKDVHSMVIKATRDTDFGVYTVYAYNRVNDARVSMSLNRATTPLVPPQFTVKPDDVTVPEGEDVSVLAAVVADPRAKVVVLFNGKVRENDDHCRVELNDDNTINLNLWKVTPADAGDYQLAAANDADTATASFTLTVIPIDKKNQPSRTTEFRFTKLGLHDQSASRTSGFVPKVNRTSSTPDTKMRPQFTSVPEDHIYKDQELVRLDASFRANPAPIVSWYLHGHHVEENDNVTIANDPDIGRCSLIISKANAEHRGQYKCIAQNSEGLESFTVNLDMEPLDAPTNDHNFDRPKFTVNPADIFVDPGKPVRIASYLMGTPRPDVKWTFNGNPLPDSVTTNYSAIQEVTAYIDKVEPSHAGVYQCIASNEHGDALITVTVKVRRTPEEGLGPAPFKLRHVDLPDLAPVDPGESGIYGDNIPPLFTSKPQDTIANKGKTVRIDTRVTGTPKPFVEWFFNDSHVALTNTPNLQLVTNEQGINSVIVKAMSETEVGRYRALATNRAGEASVTVSLLLTEDSSGRHSITDAPKFTIRPNEDYHVTLGSPLTISSATSGDPPPTVVIYHGTYIRNESSNFHILRDEIQNLTIKFDAVTADDVGHYRISATNAKGRAICSFTIVSS